MRVSYTPELIAHVRHRYENTADTLAKIATDCGISERAINRMRDREGWSRRSDRPPRGLPAAIRTLAEANAMVAAQAPTAAGDPPDEMRPTPAAIERIERLVEKELAAEEAVRAQLGPLPRPPAEAERAARTLATLTQTLHALQRLRCGLSPDIELNDDDDMPRDIDEFRRDLARRIDAFVASRTEPRDDDGDSTHAPVDASRE
jgi:hypothetical protein